MNCGFKPDIIFLISDVKNSFIYESNVSTTKFVRNGTSYDIKYQTSIGVYLSEITDSGFVFYTASGASTFEILAVKE